MTSLNLIINRLLCYEEVLLQQSASSYNNTLTKATPLPLSPVWMSIQASGPSSTKPQRCNKERSRAPSSCFAWDPRVNRRAPSWTKDGRLGISLMATELSGRSLEMKEKNNITHLYMNTEAPFSLQTITPGRGHSPLLMLPASLLLQQTQ